MSRRNLPTGKVLLSQVGELASAVPQVVTHRVVRFAKAKPLLSAHDQAEIFTMIAEKQVAFAQSWFAVVTELTLAQQQWILSCAQLCWSPSQLDRRTPRRLAGQLRDATLRIASGGIAPIHRKAVANAKRLARG